MTNHPSGICNSITFLFKFLSNWETCRFLFKIYCLQIEIQSLLTIIKVQIELPFLLDFSFSSLNPVGRDWSTKLFHFSCILNFAESRPGPGPPNFAGVLSQIILCRQINPDFNQEELCSIDKDTNEISSLLDDLQEFMPMNENSQVEGYSYEEVFGRRSRRRRNSWCDFEAFCCISKSRRLSGVWFDVMEKIAIIGTEHILSPPNRDSYTAAAIITTIKHMYKHNLLFCYTPWHISTTHDILLNP